MVIILNSNLFLVTTGEAQWVISAYFIVLLIIPSLTANYFKINDLSLSFCYIIITRVSYLTSELKNKKKH